MNDYKDLQQKLQRNHSQVHKYFKCEKSDDMGKKRKKNVSSSSEEKQVWHGNHNVALSHRRESSAPLLHLSDVRDNHCTDCIPVIVHGYTIPERQHHTTPAL